MTDVERETNHRLKNCEIKKYKVKKDEVHVVILRSKQVSYIHFC